MTRTDLEYAKAYYRTFLPSSWVQIQRDEMLAMIHVLEQAWKRLNEVEKRNNDLVADIDIIKKDLLEAQYHNRVLEIERERETVWFGRFTR